MREYELLSSFGAIDRSKLQSRALKTLRDKALADPRSALRYALHVRKGAWPDGEPVIATDGKWSGQYADEVLEGRFEAGEAAIRNNGEAAESYALRVMNKEWPEAEVNIFDPKQNSYPNEYYSTFLMGVAYDELSRPVQEWLIRENGECDECGEALPSNKRERWSNDMDGSFCSERCADHAAESQHDYDLEQWTEEEMAELDSPPSPERVKEAIRYIKNDHHSESLHNVRQALIRGDFIPDPGEEDD